MASQCVRRVPPARDASAPPSSSCCRAIPCRACARTTSSPDARSGVMSGLAAGLSASSGARDGRAQDRVRDRTRRLLSRSPRQRRGRPDRVERCIDPVVDDARGRFRHRSGRERRLRARKRGHGVSLRLMAPPESQSARRRRADAVPRRHLARRSDGAFPPASQPRTARQRDDSARQRARPRARARHRRERRRAELRSLERRRLRDRGRGFVHGHGGAAREACNSTTRCSRPASSPSTL